MVCCNTHENFFLAFSFNLIMLSFPEKLTMKYNLRTLILFFILRCRFPISTRTHFIFLIYSLEAEFLLIIRLCTGNFSLFALINVLVNKAPEPNRRFFPFPLCIGNFYVKLSGLFKITCFFNSFPNYFLSNDSKCLFINSYYKLS